MSQNTTYKLSSNAFTVLAPLLLGGMIYLLWRSHSLLMFAWFHSLGLSAPLDACRAVAAPTAALFPATVLYSLPDALWVFSFSSFLGFVWIHQSRRTAILWMLLPPTLAIGGEIGQALHIVPGTFDTEDLIFCGIAAIVAQLVVIKKAQKGIT